MNGTLLLLFTVELLMLFVPIFSHMMMKYPPTRGYAGNKLYGNVDYNLNAPLSSLTFCKGKPPGSPVLAVNPGDTIMVEFSGTARHNGGICQFSLSYDNDVNFFVIAEYDGSCPDASYQWPVKIPLTVPPCERCTFSWSWINAVGNREFYMNCADIKISKGAYSQSKMTGNKMLIANLGGYRMLQPPGSNGPPSSNSREITKN